MASSRDVPMSPGGTEQLPGLPARLEEPSVLTSPWAGSSPAAAVRLFTRAAFGLRARQDGELEKVLQQLSLWSRNQSRTREGVLFLIRRDTSSS